MTSTRRKIQIEKTLSIAFALILFGSATAVALVFGYAVGQALLNAAF